MTSTCKLLFSSSQFHLCIFYLLLFARLNAICNFNECALFVCISSTLRFNSFFFKVTTLQLSYESIGATQQLQTLNNGRKLFDIWQLFWNMNHDALTRLTFAKFITDAGHEFQRHSWDDCLPSAASSFSFFFTHNQQLHGNWTNEQVMKQKESTHITSWIYFLYKTVCFFLFSFS